MDLAMDSPPHSRTTMTVLGPTLAPLELAGRTLLALFGRAEARDFADVYVRDRLRERRGQRIRSGEAVRVGRSDGSTHY